VGKDPENAEERVVTGGKSRKLAAVNGFSHFNYLLYFLCSCLPCPALPCSAIAITRISKYIANYLLAAAVFL
jgi:hypothetical protein